MQKWVDVINRSTGGDRILRARWCSSFVCKLRGLTFRKSLGLDEGIVLVENSESRLNTAIHMLGVFFSIGVVWIDNEFVVVDLILAKPWRFYTPKNAAKYILEGSPDILEKISLGHKLEFVDVEAI